MLKIIVWYLNVACFIPQVIMTICLIKVGFYFSNLCNSVRVYLLSYIVYLNINENCALASCQHLSNMITVVGIVTFFGKREREGLSFLLILHII